MNNLKFLKEVADPKYFDIPQPKFKNKLMAFTLGYSKNKIENINPYIYICNKTTIFDKELISETLKCDFVFLKDEIVKKVYLGKLSPSEKKELKTCVLELKKQFVSLVVFPEKDITVFGDTGEICQEMTELLIGFGLDIKFVNFVGTYFVAPIWAPTIRKGKTKFAHQFTIKQEEIVDLSKQKAHELFQNYMPSSATVYAYKFPIELRSNNLACDLETIAYCCPTCGKFFSLYSEFNCLKCKECGSAVEMHPNGTILLSRNVRDFDELKTYQFKKLNKLEFTTLPLVEYENASRCAISPSGKIEILGDIKVSIYADKVVITKNDFKFEFKIKDIVDFEILPRNTAKFTLKNDEQIILRGNNKENFYIIFDLIKIFN